MHLEHTTVSRKTPRDGKLEISAGAAERLRPLAPRLRVAVGGAVADAALGEMTCSCRGPGERHVHHFLESELLKTLPAESAVSLALEETGIVTVRRG